MDNEECVPQWADLFFGIMVVVLVFAAVCYIGSGGTYINQGLTEKGVRWFVVAVLLTGVSTVSGCISHRLRHPPTNERDVCGT